MAYWALMQSYSLFAWTVPLIANSIQQLQTLLNVPACVT